MLAVIKARDLDDALAIANGTPYALTGGIYSRSPEQHRRVKREFRVGNLYINRKITGGPGRSPAVRRLQAVGHRLQGRRARLFAAIPAAARYHREHHAARLRSEYTGIVTISTLRCRNPTRAALTPESTPPLSINTLGVRFMKRHCIGLLPFAFALRCRSPGATPAEFKGHDGLVFTVAFSNDGKILATASFDNTVKLWDFATGKESRHPQGPHRPRLLRRLQQRRHHRGHLQPRQDHPPLEPQGRQDRSRNSRATPTSSLRRLQPRRQDARLRQRGQTVSLWDAKTPRKSRTSAPTRNRSTASPSTRTAASSPPRQRRRHQNLGRQGPKRNQVDDGRSAQARHEGRAEEGRAEERGKGQEGGQEERHDQEGRAEGNPRRFYVVAFTPDGKQILSGGHDKYLRYWSIADGKETKKLGPSPDYIFGLAVSKDGKYVAAAGYGGSLRVYEVDSGKEVYNHHNKGWITYCVAFTPDGKSVVTGHEKLSKGIAKVTAIGK